MAIIQISKIIHRTGANVDLPQLDEGELGFSTDERKLYIGNDPNLYPALANGITTQTEILTEISTINWSKIDGTANSTLNLTEPIVDGQLFVANNNVWTNAGGPTGTLTIDLGDADNVLLRGGLNGYVLTTDGTGNLSWQGSGVITYGIANVSKANPAIVTTTGNNAVTTGVAVTIFGVSGMTQLPTAGANGTNKFYAYKISSNTFSLYSDSGLTAPVNSGGFSPAIANTGNAVVSFYQTGIGVPGGSNTQVQFNDGFGVFGGAANYTFNKVTNTLRVVGNANVTNLNATSTINGNLNGPIGVSGANTGAFTTITTTSTISASGNVNTTGNVSVLGNIVSDRNITGNNLTISNNLTTGNLSINGNVQSNLIPNANVTYNLGNNTNRWNDLYLAGNSIFLGNLTLSVDANGLNIPANVVAANANLGNIVRANFITGTLTSSSQPNITSIGALANLSVTGNVNLGNVANVKLSGGVANYVLTTDGNSNLSWQSTQFIATPAAGPNAAVQFNVDDAITGNSQFTYDYITTRLTVPAISATTVNVSGNTNTANLSVSTNLSANVISVTGTITSANLNTGIISATGNITSSANVNAVAISASGNVNANRINANLVGTGSLTATGNAQINGTLSVGNNATFSQNANISGNLIVLGNITGNNITSSNNFTADLITGDAANLGNLSVTGNATINAANISTNLNVTNTINATQVNANLTGIMLNGTSNAQFTAINGSFAVSVGGNPNVLTVTNSSISVAGNITTAGNVAANNLTVSSNANITSGNINATGNINANSSIVANGNISGNNLNVTNNISAAGNLTANNFFGRIQGALANGNSNVSIATANGNIVLTSGGNSTLTVTPANITVSGNTVIAGNATTIGLSASGNVNANNVVVTSNIAGNNLSLSGTITSGAITSNGLISTTGNVSAGNLNITANSSIASGNLNVAGNITGNNSNIANIYGNFISINGLANVVTLNANGSISTTGNVTSAANVVANNASVGNLITAGALTVTANVQGGNFNASNAITAGGSLLVNSITSNTTISAGGNVSVTGNVAVAQAITATGNINTSANLTVAVNANVNGNLRVGGNVSSNLIPSANNTYNLGTPTQRWQDLYLSNSTIYLGTTTLSANASGVTISGNIDTANISTGNINATGVASVVGVVASGNVLAGNVNAVTNATVGGSLTVTQWANSGNITTARVIASGNITTSANLSVTGLTTVTGNVDAGNLRTAGLITSTGNITGGNILTAGLVSSTGNVNAGNLRTAGLITSTGNITGGNILTAGAISAAGNANVNVMYAAGNIITAASLNANSGLVSSQTLRVTNTANIGTANITTVDSHLSPSGVTNWNLGAPNSPWRAIYAGANGVIISNVAITSDGSNIEIPNAEINSARVNSFVATTSANLGPIGNFKVTGGSNGQILRTDGTGNLSFINPALIVLPVGTNTQVQFNDNGVLGASSSFTFNKTTSTLFATQITGNGVGISNIAGANVSGAVPSAVVAQNVTACNQPNITSVGTLTSLSVSGNLSAGNANLGNLATANFVSGVLTSTSQPNVTSLGPLTGLTVSNITGQVNLAYTSDIFLGNIGNLHITGGANGQFLRTDGLGNLYWSIAQASRLENGNSNISIDLNGNTRFNIGGVANTVIIGRDNHFFTGTTFMPSLFVTNLANLGNVGNVKITGGSGGQVLRTDGAGNLTWGQAPAAQSLLNGGTSVILNPSGNIGFTVGGVSNVITFTNTGMVGGRISGITGLSATGLIQLGDLSNVKITGGGVGQVIITDGAGNLSFTAAPAPISVINGSSNIIVDPSGSVRTSIAGTANVFVIANTGTTIAGKVTFSNVANVTIPGGNANQVLTTDGTGNLSWANPPAISFISNGTSNLAIDLNSTIRIGATGTPNVVVISNTEMTTSNLVVNIGANLGYAANLKLLGGSNGQILIANGNSGNVEWTTFPPANLLDQGTSNVQVNNSNIVISANGVANVVNITQTGMTVTGNVNASRINLANIANLKVSGGTSGQLITTDGAGNLSFSSLSNGAAIESGTSNIRFGGTNGPVLISVGAIANVANITNSGISVAGSVTALNVNATAMFSSTISTTGTVTAANMFVNANLTVLSNAIIGNINAGNVNFGNLTLTGNAAVGNLVATANIGAGNLSVTSNITSGNLTTGTISATGIAATGTISSTGNVNAANSLITGTASVAGNIVANNISVTGALTAPSFTIANFNTSGSISAGGSVTAQNLFINGTANINAGNLSVSGTIAQAATLSAGNLTSPGNISAAGNVTGGNILTSGIISSSANIQAPNAFIATNANVGNVFATGTISAVGNIVGLNIIGNFTGAIANGTSNIRAPIVNGPITVSVGGIANSLVVTNLGANVLGYANIGGAITGANLSVTGNITGANLNGNVFGLRHTNGNSNVTVNANSNVTISVAGVANVLTVTNAGANITGSANITGAAVVGTGLTLNASNSAQRFNINNAQTPATNPMSIYHDGSGLYVAGTGYTYFAEGLTYFQNPASFRGSIRNDAGTLTVNASSQLNVANTTVSTTTTNGALVVAGGVGIGGNINIGGVLSGNISSATVNGFAVGYRDWPTSNPTTPYTPVLTDAGRQFVYSGAATLNIPLNASVAYPIGAEFKITNNSAGVITVTPISGVTLKLAGTATVGTRSVGANGIATLTKAGTDTWFITGAGVT